MYIRICGLMWLIAVSSFCAASELQIPDELQEYINEIHSMCLDKMGLTEDGHKTYNIDNKDPKWMCYMQCLMMTSKWMAPDQEIQYDYIISSAHPQVADLLVPAVNKCRNIQEGTHECEKAYNFNKCMFGADPENWFFI
uniref:Odorant-binding protein 13 n=1 Tax=Dastarcus helophoroides TaxID=1169899 RepID=A0A1I9HZQ4_9CUCU|nr:odorant-binding protein 13 [Dastarcus helophoroides]